MKTVSMALLVAAFAVTPMMAKAQAAPAGTKAAAAPAAVPADQQATKEQMAQLFKVMRLEEEMQETLRAIPAMMQEQIRTQMNDMYGNLPDDKHPTDEQKTKLNELLKQYMDRAAHLYSADEILGDIVGIYQRHMTKADVDAYIAFYSSPAGQHLLDSKTKIMGEYMPLVMKRVDTGGAELSAGFAKDAQAIAKTPTAAK